MRLMGRARWAAGAHRWAWDAPPIALLAVLPVFFLRELPGGLPPYGGDILVHVYPLLSVLAHGLHAGRPTLWNYYAAGGYPLAPYSALAFYPPVLLALLLFPVTGALAALYALYLAVLGIGTYLLAAELGQSRPARLLAAVTLAYGGFVAAHAYAGHIFELGAICPLPLAFLLLRRAIRRHSLRTALGCGAVVGLMLLAVGVQFLPFALAPLPLLAVWHIIFPPHPRPVANWSLRRGRRSSALFLTRTRGIVWPLAALGAAGLVALALSAVFVLPFAEILPATLRSGAVPLSTATAQSLPWGDLTMFAAPNGLGNAAADSYWPAGRFSPYFHEIYAYVGVLPLLLAPVALARCRAARPYGLLALVALLVMLGDNTPLYGLLYHLPGAGLFRVPARAGLTLDFALALLAGFGLDALRQEVRGWRRALAPLLPGAVAMLVALQALVTIVALAGHGDGIPLSARALAFGGATRLVASLLVVLAACLVLIFQFRAHALDRIARPHHAWAFVLPALAALDLLTANSSLLRPADPAAYYSAEAGVLSPRDTTGRLLAADTIAPAVPLGLCMVTRGCYDVQDAAPLALEDYWRLSHRSVVDRAHSSVATGRDTALDVDPFFLRLFGVDALYSAVPLLVAGLRARQLVTSVRWIAPGGVNWNVTRFAGRSLVYDYPAALPRIFVAPDTVTVGRAADALALLRRGSVDPGRVAVLSPSPGKATSLLGALQGAWADWLAGDDDNSLTVRADGGTRGGYLVVDDGWFPGWTATVDGRAAPVLRADYLLRAVHLLPGRHTVRLVYAPLIYLLGAAITLATALALLLIAAYALARHSRFRLVSA